MFNFLRPASEQAKRPSVAEVAAAVSRKEIVLIDVRELGEVQASGKAKGALHIPLGVLALRADPAAPDALLKPGLPVAVYCLSGGRSGRAAQLLSSLGYGPVWNIGGLADWQAGGGQVELL